MSHHPHPAHQPKHEHKAKPASSGGSPAVKPHVKWGLMIAIVLMLIALAIYVFTDNESLQPGETLQPEVPAAP